MRAIPTILEGGTKCSATSATGALTQPAASGNTQTRAPRQQGSSESFEVTGAQERGPGGRGRPCDRDGDGNPDSGSSGSGQSEGTGLGESGSSNQI